MDPGYGFDPEKLGEALTALVEQEVTRLYAWLEVEDIFGSGAGLFYAARMRELPRLIQIKILPEVPRED